MDISQALKSLIPDSEFSVEDNDYDKITWYEWNVNPKPSREQVEAEIEILKVKNQNTEYQRQRAPEYPELKELADALYWSSKGDNTKLDEYYAKCEAVKDKYPKPN